MNCYGTTDKGRSRTQNQDCYMIARQGDGLLACVCDGIGGAQAGDVASRLAAAAMEHAYKDAAPGSDGDLLAWLTAAVAQANKEVYTQAAAKPEYHGMGTTMVAVLRTAGRTLVANVGDSRAYRLDASGTLTQVTHDHTLINDLRERGGLDERQLALSGLSHVITRAVGIATAVTVDCFEVEGQWRSLLLCSDGLYNSVSNQAIVEALTSSMDLVSQGQVLVKQANDAGGPDNITLVILTEDRS